MAAMFGGIALRGKLLVTLSGGLEGEVRVYDLGARRLVRQIPVPPRVAGRVEAGGVAIDADSSFWVADGAACQLRRFNPFGGELEPIGLEPTRSKPRDRRGLPAQARGVALDAHERLWVSGGDRPRVHGLQVFEREGRFVQSIAAFGRREGLYGPDADSRRPRLACGSITACSSFATTAVSWPGHPTHLPGSRPADRHRTLSWRTGGPAPGS
jgi:hypothetical protein